MKLNGDRGTNDIILIPRIGMFSKESDFPAIFKQKQFPVVSTYYLTFNKAQEQSFNKCRLYLPRSVFTHEKIYVRLGRYGDCKNVYVYANQEEFEHLRDYLPENRTYTHNVVYTEVFNQNSS